MKGIAFLIAFSVYVRMALKGILIGELFRLCGAECALAHQVDYHVASGLGLCEYVVG